MPSALLALRIWAANSRITMLRFRVTNNDPQFAANHPRPQWDFGRLPPAIMAIPGLVVIASENVAGSCAKETGSPGDIAPCPVAEAVHVDHADSNVLNGQHTSYVAERNDRGDRGEE